MPAANSAAFRPIYWMAWFFFVSTSLVHARIHVPSDVADLQTALDQAQDGELIVLASGVYPPPAGGFLVTQLHRAFHIKAEEGGHVVLDGQGADPIVRQDHSGGVNWLTSILFENITFAHGFSSENGVGGAVTVRNAVLTFENCRFENNQTSAPQTGGGAIHATQLSVIYIINSLFTGNRATVRGGAIDLGDRSDLIIMDSEFVDNRVDHPNHDPMSSGGAIHADYSQVQIANSLFQNNRAGFAGGAIFMREAWDLTPPRASYSSELYVTNSHFTGNMARPDVSVAETLPSRGGAIHTEDNGNTKVYSSRFTANQAENGGALSTYRGAFEIGETVFEGNFVSSSKNDGGLGGALWASSDDLQDASTNNGEINRPSALITIRRALFAGRAGLPSARSGGCLHVGGDTNRTYGLAGFDPTFPLSGNRAALEVFDSVFDDCDVESTVGRPSTGLGGAMSLIHTDFGMTNSLVMHSDALGNDGAAGGIHLTADSSVTIEGSTFSNNSARNFAGALVMRGGYIRLQMSQFADNGLVIPATLPITPAVSESATLFLGPGIHEYGFADTELDGVVQNSTFVATGGSILVEDDRAAGPINDVKYWLNELFGSAQPFFNPLVGAQSTSEWNALTILRDPMVEDTEKVSGSIFLENTDLGTEPDLATLVTIPHQRLTTSQTPELTPAAAYLAFAWSGLGPATLNGAPEVAKSATRLTSSGLHTLNVGAVSSQDEVQELGPIHFHVQQSRYFFPPAVAWNSVFDWQANVDVECVFDSIGSPYCKTTSPAEHQVLATGRFFFILLSKEGGAWQPSYSVFNPVDLPDELLISIADHESESLADWTSVVTP